MNNAALGGGAVSVAGRIRPAVRVISPRRA